MIIRQLESLPLSMSNELWLVAENDPEIRAVLAGICKIWEVQMQEIEDGYQALEWVRQVDLKEYTGPIPSVVLMEIRLPGPQGHEIARYMHRLKVFEHTCVILMTEFEYTPEERDEIMAFSGADLFIEQPLPGLFELNRRIRDVVTRKRATRVATGLLSERTGSTNPFTA